MGTSLQGSLARHVTATGVLFALLVGFIAVEVWNNLDKAKAAVATKASALRAVVLSPELFPQEQKTRIRTLINRHIDACAMTLVLFATSIALGVIEHIARTRAGHRVAIPGVCHQSGSISNFAVLIQYNLPSPRVSHPLRAPAPKPATMYFSMRKNTASTGVRMTRPAAIIIPQSTTEAL